MKHIVCILFILLIFPVISFATDVYLDELEGGDSLPLPYSCLTYQGRTSIGLGLLADGCAGKPDNWLPVPKFDATRQYPKGYYATEFNGDILIFEPTNYNTVKVYRRILS